MISENLKDILEKKKMSYQQLADESCVPLETVRNIYYGRVADPKASTIFALSKVLDVSMNWLMGESPYTKDEERLVMNYRRCGSHGKSMVTLVANYEAELSRHERNAENKFTIPCIVPTCPVYDGLSYNASNMIDVTTDNPDAYIAIQFTSNEFAPTYCKGDQVLISDRFPKSGETAMFFIDDMIYCRTFEEHDNEYILRSLNRQGQDFHMKRMDKIKRVGTCVGIIRA